MFHQLNEYNWFIHKLPMEMIKHGQSKVYKNNNNIAHNISIHAFSLFHKSKRKFFFIVSTNWVRYKAARGKYLSDPQHKIIVIPFSVGFNFDSILPNLIFLEKYTLLLGIIDFSFFFQVSELIRIKFGNYALLAKCKKSTKIKKI